MACTVLHVATRRQTTEVMQPLRIAEMVCTITRTRVSNWKWQVKSGAEGLCPNKKSRVEVGSDAESEGSGTRGWKQEVSSALVGIRELLREQNGYVKRIAQSLDGGLGAGDDDDDSTMRE